MQQLLIEALSLFVGFSFGFGEPKQTCEPWSLLHTTQRARILQEVQENQKDYVIVVRHADANSADNYHKSVRGKDIPTPDYCSGATPPLTARGIKQAEKLGQAIKGIGWSLGEPLTSPICRAHQTAQLAFGDKLTVMSDMQLRRDGESSRTTLRARINEPSVSGVKVLISHSVPIRRATGVEPACGETLIVKKASGNKRPQCIARILPNEWTNPDHYSVTESYWTSPKDCASDAVKVRTPN